MAGVLDQLDQLLLDSIQRNVFSDTNQYLDAIRAQQVPPSIANQIQATDPVRNGNDNIYRTNSEFAPMAGATPVANYVDVFAISNWLKNVGREFGVGGSDQDRGRRIAKLATYAGTQLLLGTLNPGDLEVGGVLNQIVNPLSFVAASVPFLRATAIPSPNLAAAFSVTGEVYQTGMAASIALGTERLVLMRAGLYQKAINGSDLLKLEIPTPGFVGDIAKQGSHDTLQKPGLGLPGVHTITNQVDGGSVADVVLAGKVHTNLYSPERKYLDSPAYPQSALEKEVTKRFPAGALDKEVEALRISALFKSRKFPGTSVEGETNITYIAKSRATNLDDKPEPPLTTPANVDVRVDVSEDADTALVPLPIPDGEVYLPFFFQDLRKGLDDQYLYFRAFLKNDLAETFTPDWQIDRYYGRVDQIPTYIGTIRTISLAFDIVAWGPHDLPTMYKKIHKLQSMVYPMYDPAGFMQSGPIIRMRVGDLLVASGKKGIPGYITSLDFSYDDGIWNMKTDFKVPRKVSVSLGFNVIHEGNPGIYPDNNTFTFGSGKVNEENKIAVNEDDIRGIMSSARSKK